MNKYFFDTYAFIEIIYGNSNYRELFKDIRITTSKLNLMELYYGLLRKHDKRVAELYYDRFLPFAQEISDEIIKEAMQFRFLHKEKKLSYVDCIGYIMAQKSNLNFLTGDKQFEGMPKVEFVK